MWLLPMWWLLGIEQVIWTPLAVLTLALVYLRHGIRPPQPIALAFLLFLAAALLAGTAIESLDRMVSFARVAYGYLGIAAILTALTHPAIAPERLRGVAIATVAAGVGGATLAVAAWAGAWRPDFTLPWARLVPEPLMGSELLQRHVTRSLGGDAWALGAVRFRPSGPFLFATGLGMAMATSLPLAYGVVRRTRGWRRLVAAAGALMLLAALVATTGRTPVAALVAGGLITFAVVATGRRSFVLLFGAVITAAAVLALAFPQPLQDALDFAIHLRGTSTVDRLRIYDTTTRMWFEEAPWIGFGTERSVASLPYAAGSHSFPLGVLFRFGAVGFATLTLLALLTTHAALRAAYRSPEDGIPLAWAWVTLLLASLTDAPDLDLLLLVLVTMPVALLARWGLRL